MRENWRQWLRNRFPLSVRDGLITLGILSGMTFLCALLQHLDGRDEFTSMLFILAVFLISRFTNGYFFGILSALLSVLAVNFAFTYPYLAFNFTLSGYPMAMISLLVVAIVTSAMTTRIKRHSQVQLEAEREKLRGNLLRSVSHDLRTPLTAILGASSVLLENEQTLPPAQRQLLLGDICREARGLIAMVENLLSVTRIGGNVGARIVKTEQAAEELVAAAAVKFRKNHSLPTLQVQVPEALLLVPVDPILIGQVLGNLLENAARHGKNATVITLRVWQGANAAIFEIADNGQGIAAERLEHLFDGKGSHVPGAGGDDKRDLGIGLSVCDAIVRAHGGVITGENQKSGGAVFRFTLPLEDGKI